MWQGDHKDGWLAGAAKFEILNVEAAGKAGRWAGKAVVAQWRRWATGRCVAYVVERSGLASVSSAAITIMVAARVSLVRCFNASMARTSRARISRGKVIGLGEVR